MFCHCVWMYFPVEAGWRGGTKHKETLFKSVQMRQLSQILYTSEWISPRQWGSTMVCLSFLRVNTQKCTPRNVTPCRLMLLWKLFSSRFYTFGIKWIPGGKNTRISIWNINSFVDFWYGVLTQPCNIKLITSNVADKLKCLCLHRTVDRSFRMGVPCI